MTTDYENLIYTIKLKKRIKKKEEINEFWERWDKTEINNKYKYDLNYYKHQYNPDFQEEYKKIFGDYL